MSLALAVARGTMRLLGGVVAAKALDFAFYLLLARKLGVAAFGLYTFAISFTLLFNIVADMGLAGIFAREVTRTPGRVRLLLSDILRMKGVLALVTVAATLGIASVTGAPDGSLPLIAFITVGLLLNSGAALFDALLKSSGRTGAAGISQVGQSAAAVIAGTALIAGGAGPTSGALAYLVASAVHLAGTVWFARDLWGAPDLSAAAPAPEVEEIEAERPRWRERIGLLREAFPLALSGAFIAIYFRIDAVMLQALVGGEAVGLYGGIYRLWEFGAPICAAYHSVLFPALVRAANSARDSLGHLCQQSMRILILCAVGYSAFVAAESERIVTLILGPDYQSAAPALAILIWATTPALLGATLVWALAAVDRQRRATWAVGATAVANIALNYFLIPRLSFLGAAASTVASELLCFTLLCVALGHGLNPARIVEMTWRPAVAALAVIVTLDSADPLLPMGATGLAQAAAIGFVIYMIPLIGLGAVGRKEVALLVQILPLRIQDVLARIPRWAPVAEPAVHITETPVQARAERRAPRAEILPARTDIAPRRARRSLLELSRQQGPRNALRIAIGKARTMAFSRFYTGWLRARGVRIAGGCTFLGPVEILGDPERITIGERCFFHKGTTLWTHDYGSGHGAIDLRRGVALGRRVTINSYFEITIDEGSGLGDGTYVQDNDHGTDPSQPFQIQSVHGRPIRIGRDVWIGARTIVLKGVTIGDQVVIGAGSVVVKSIEPNVVAVGNPCRAVKLRGSDRLADAA